MDNLDAEMEVLQHLAARTPRFTAIDDLPLEKDPAERRHASVEFQGGFDGPQDQNQYFRTLDGSDTSSDTRRRTNDFPASQFPRFSRVSESQSRVSELQPGGFSLPLSHEAVLRGGDLSVRRASGVENVTTRETKRPKEREKEKEYRRRTLTRADCSLPIFVDREGA